MHFVNQAGPPPSATGQWNDEPDGPQRTTPSPFFGNSVQECKGDVRSTVRKAPQGTLETQVPLIEAGAWKIRYLHQTRHIDLHPLGGPRKPPGSHRSTPSC